MELKKIMKLNYLFKIVDNSLKANFDTLFQGYK